MLVLRVRNGSNGEVDLDELWNKLKLDSLTSGPTPFDTHLTLRPDFELETVISKNTDTPFRLNQRALESDEKLGGHDEFLLDRQLGEGGMGTVRLAHQDSLSRDVAIKMPHRNGSASLVSALVREAKVTGALEHPGIIPVHSMAFDSHGVPALVMKRVDGVSWAELLRMSAHATWNALTAATKDRLDANLNIFMQVCNALAFAHRQQVIHRDLKPANILIGEFGEVYVADWGVALRLVREHQRPAGLVGTPAYFAPEMISGDDSQMDVATDIYLLGATLYHVLTGVPPHNGADLREVLRLAARNLPTPFSGSVPTELFDICRKAMQNDKAQRFASALEFRDAIARFIKHRSTTRLISATNDRLVQLSSLLRDSAPAASLILPKVSECRFGFMQALHEWPENEVAELKLHETLVLAARYEIGAGNESAARALVAEMKTVPPEIAKALDSLEEEVERSKVRKTVFNKLQKDLDPRTALRERLYFFAIIAAGVSSAMVLPMFSFWRKFEGQLGGNSLLLRLSIGFSSWLLSVVMYRKSLMQTRINRAVVWLVGLTFAGVGVSRLISLMYDASAAQTLSFDLVPVSIVGAAAGITLHKGFWMMTVAGMVGLLGVFFAPHWAPQIFSTASVVGLAVVAVTWMNWRSELE
jgi:eukaryotic-like serine/threonine-protein kinase